jgi:DNA polymerase delta subunit 2
VYEGIGDTYDRFELWLRTFVDTMDVDVMPGSQDFSNAYFPQQALNSFLFPELAACETLNLVTNPHKFTMANGLEFLGTSGQPLHDIHLYSALGEED